MQTILNAHHLSNEALQTLEQIIATDIKEMTFRLGNGKVVMVEIKDVPPPMNELQRIKECTNSSYQEITLKKNGKGSQLYVERTTKIRV